MPNLSGLEVPAAQNALISQGLVLGTQTTQTSDTIPAGRVISQTPPAGDSAAKGSKVDVTVSTGKNQTSVPNLVGLTSQDQARAALVDANLVLGKVTQVDSDQPAGAVVAQSVPAATLVDAGTAIDISGSNGQVK
ncbi:MAG: PASTA domain-containing protein, partial [Aquirufa sp.]